jgi:hypothetical protein
MKKATLLRVALLLGARYGHPVGTGCESAGRLSPWASAKGETNNLVEVTASF